jgi:hypothetical protein
MFRLLSRLFLLKQVVDFFRSRRARRGRSGRW